MTAANEEATGTPRPDPGDAVGSNDTADELAAAEEPGTAGTADERAAAIAGTRFAHASEAEMARILDFYAVRWQYEPMTFPILWNLDGEVVESFAPDFYLPDLELFLEMTTLRQRLVRKKNRKLRRLRELYPGIRIKLFYARDFRAMMLKYGRYALAEAITGTSGQVVPDRASSITEAAATPPLAPAELRPAVGALFEPAMPGATPRSRPVRRRRRRLAATEVGAEQESGA